MKIRKSSYLGLLFIIIGILMFIFYCKTGIVFFKDFDLVTEVENPKIFTYEQYIARGHYEDKVLGLSLLSFVIGILLVFNNKKKPNK